MGSGRVGKFPRFQYQGLLVLLLLIRVVEYETIPIPDRHPLCPFVNGRAMEDEKASRILDHNGSTELWSPSLSPGGHGNCTSDHSPAFEEVRQKADFKLLQLECP